MSWKFWLIPFNRTVFIRMARMHARKKGRSRSVKPHITKPPEWISYTKEEVTEIIIKLAKDDVPASKIGLILRDQYGVPDSTIITGKKITKILKENDLTGDLPEDLRNLIRRALKLREHIDKHSKDRHNKRGLHLIESKIRRLSKYYIKNGSLEKGWRYDPEKARLLV